MPEQASPSPEFQALTDYLDAKKYAYTPYPLENRIYFSVCGLHADYRIQFRITRDGDYFEMMGHYPLRIRDVKLRPSVAELFTRANYKMLLGKFEMDMDDGEIRFHASHLIDGGIFTADTVERVYMTGLALMDRYFPALMQHIHAGYTPEDAVFHAELDMHADAVEENPRSARQEKPKGRPSSAKTTAPRPAKKPHRKKSGGGQSSTGQGELPI